MINIEELKRNYSKPTKYSESACQDGEYCVGGVLCLAFNIRTINNGFPGEGELVDILMKVNPNLDFCAADRYARNIILNNDNARFDCAWTYLETALNYGRSL